MADDAPDPLPEVKIWTRLHADLRPDASRTVLRPFMPEYPDGFSTGPGSRARAIIERLLTLDDDMLTRALRRLSDLIDQRHRNMRAVLLRRFEELKAFVPSGAVMDERRKLLIGGFFSEEYSFEAAALFNPSIVPHWDQSGVPQGDIRLIVSLRGIGEGHVSSVTFRTGTWSADGAVRVDQPSHYAEPPIIEPMEGQQDSAALCLHFEDAEDLSEAVLFPIAPSQKQGVEDLRLVRFTEEDGTPSYIGTYTAFSGTAIRQEILTTTDFKRFSMQPLEGKAAQNKGMALFPRRIDGRYVMLGRQDNENIWLMTSDDLYRWDEAEKLVTPKYPWEFVQMGNCGAPIEIDEGWLVMTHSVGLVRNYTIGACLLDKRDPARLIARTTHPLLRPELDQRDGYVPNVVYSCGSMIDGRRLLVPYGVADNFAAFASTSVDAILSHME